MKKKNHKNTEWDRSRRYVYEKYKKRRKENEIKKKKHTHNPDSGPCLGQQSK